MQVQQLPKCALYKNKRIVRLSSDRRKTFRNEAKRYETKQHIHFSFYCNHHKHEKQPHTPLHKPLLVICVFVSVYCISTSAVSGSPRLRLWFNSRRTSCKLKEKQSTSTSATTSATTTPLAQQNHNPTATAATKDKLLTSVK